MDVKKEIEKIQRDKLQRDMELQDATEDAIKLARNFTAELESYNPIVRCLTIHAINKTYRRLFPKVFESLEKIGV